MNNWFLINYLKRDSPPDPTRSVEQREHPEYQKQSAANGHSEGSLSAERAVEEESTRVNESTVESLEAFMKTERFESAMRAYHRRSQEQYREMEQQFRGMNVDELYDAYIAAESKREKLAAVQYLAQQEFTDLDTEKIKDIYRDEDLDRWTRSSVLGALLQTQDAESLAWAKQRVANGDAMGYEYSQLLNGINERDPEFARELVGNFDISLMSAMEIRRLRYLNDVELTSVFLKNNIGKILRSDRSGDYVVMNSTEPLNLRRSQQERLADLMGSEQKSKRSFAIALASNILDVDLLREAYSKLNRGQDKRNFVNMLKMYGQNEQQSALARELATSSDDPIMRRLFPDS